MDRISQLAPWMSVLIVFGSMYVLAAVVLILGRMIHRRPSWEAIQPPMMQVTGTLLGLVLAFLLASVWKQVSDARNIVYKEVHGFNQLINAASALDDSTKGEIGRLAKDYIQLVVSEEWEAMNYGQEGVKTGKAFERLRQHIIKMPPETPFLDNVHSSLNSALNIIITARSDRLMQSQDNVSRHTWVIVFILVTMVMLTVVLVHERTPRGQILALALVTTMQSGLIFLIIVHDQPFAHPELVNLEAFTSLVTKL